MRVDIQATIQRFFSGGVFSNPLDEKSLFSAEHRKLIYDIIGEIKHRLGRDLAHGSDGQYDLSERIVIRSHVVLRLSFLGPFGHINAKLARRHLSEGEIKRITDEIKEILDRCEILLLAEDAVREEVPWLEPGDSLVAGKVRVWNCLFCEY